MQDKMNAKFDPKLEKEAIDWMEAVTGERIRPKSLAEALHDGQYLCRLINCLKPGAVAKIGTSALAFKQMENIEKFIKAAVAYGVPVSDTFQTVDLFEAQDGAGNVVQVIDTIHALGRAAQRAGFRGPTLGARMADAAPRNFSEETMKAGNAVIGLQAGFNRGASQAGMAAPGTSRKI